MSASIQGLTDEQAQAQQARGLGNAVAFKTGRSYWQILRKNALTFINIVLFAISILLILMGQSGDALVTAGLVLLNVVVSVYQEGRTKYKLDRLALQVRAQAKVIRNGVEKFIDPDEIVQGDVLICRAGDQIFADGSVVEGNHLSVDESNLTGESERVYKTTGDSILSGSFCLTGSAYYEAEKVGAESHLNQLTAAARVFRQEKTPLQRDVDTVIRVLIVIVTFLGLLLGISSIYSRSTTVDYLRIAAVIVALVPQGLFVMTTVAYGMGILRVARKGALIQETNAVESTSHINLLCLDKTGTLTTHRLQLREIIPLGKARKNPQLLETALGDFAINMETADRTLSAIRREYPGKSRVVSRMVPFSSEYKWSSLVYSDEESKATYVLGAPEVLAGKIHRRDEILNEVDRLTGLARRVLLFTRSNYPASISNDSKPPELPPDLEPLGLIVFQEELRSDARETLEHFSNLGVKIKIISGDNPDTVAALARQAGLLSDRTLSGLVMKTLNAAELNKAALETSIFGRITPQQKKQLIDIYRQRGYYTAMIGDGVNDILPLKEARLSVAVQSGAPATLSIADIILLKDRFSSLPNALREGQRIVRGMLDVIRLLLTRTLYILLMIVATQVAGAPFPLTPKHNALIALLTVGVPIIAIAAWAKPGKPPARLLRATLFFIIPAAITISLLATGVYLAYLGIQGDVNYARTALTAVSVFCGLLLLPFVEPPGSWWVAGDELSGDPRPSLLALVMLSLYGLVLIIPALRRFFELAPLSGWDLLIIAGLACLWALLQRMIWRRHLFERLLDIQTE